MQSHVYPSILSTHEPPFKQGALPHSNMSEMEVTFSSSDYLSNAIQFETDLQCMANSRLPHHGMVTCTQALWCCRFKAESIELNMSE